jgi:hypothetical protein
MAKPRLKVEIGKEYGWLTVIRELPKDSTGHFQFLTYCRCGEERIVTPSILYRGTPKCNSCGKADGWLKMRKLSVGQRFKSWEILNEVGKNGRGQILFNCKCLLCGNTSVKTTGGIRASHGEGCKQCQPDYHFKIFGDKAIGTLKDGTNFIIDSEEVDKVSRYHWMFKEGYILCTNTKMKKIRLHNLLMGVRKTGNYCVDHINRNPLDCRKSNLRIVTLQQNSMNRSITSANTTGYVGVIFHKRQKSYFAKVGLNNKNIYLGSSKNKIECAQMYNFASELLFGEFVGHRNDVPEPRQELKQKVYKKCLPYLNQAIEATQSCGFFDVLKQQT